MRIIVLLDRAGASKKPRIDAALERIKKDYAGASDVSWRYLEQDYMGVPWGEYSEGALGLDFTWMNARTREISQKYKLEFDNVIFCVDPVNWRDGVQPIGGWNITETHAGLYRQIVKVSDSDEWLYKIFAMEIAHMWDNMVWDELSINFNSLKRLDFDYDIVHGESPEWGKPAKGTWAENYTRTGYYTDFDYSKLIKEFGIYIGAATKKRLDRFNAEVARLKKIISLAETVIELLKKLAALRTRKDASAIHIPLDGSV